MPSVERSFSVTTPPVEVLDYLKDFGRTEEWDPGTERCTQNGSGPVEVGTSWHNVSKIAGVRTELTYTLTRLTDDMVQFVGKNDTATSTDTITVTPSGSGSELTYHANLELHGAAKLATPAAKLVFEKLGNDTQKKMTEVLNSLRMR